MRNMSRSVRWPGQPPAGPEGGGDLSLTACCVGGMSSNFQAVPCLQLHSKCIQAGTQGPAGALATHKAPL